MARKEQQQVLYKARSSGRVRIKGVLHIYAAGRTVLPGDHPLVRHLPGRFLPLRLSGAQVVETEPAPIVAEAVVIEPEIVVEEPRSSWRSRA